MAARRKIPGQDPADEESSDKQMNFGFTFGDEGIPEPYFYITAYPLPDAASRTDHMPHRIKAAHITIRRRCECVAGTQIPDDPLAVVMPPECIYSKKAN